MFMADGGAAPKAEDKRGKENPAVNELLEYAQSLRDEKSELFGRIEANRDTLRNYKRMGLLSPKQVEAIDAFYPVRKTTEKAAA